MRIIRDLETEPRHVYSGTIGYLRPDGSARFNVAIRTMLVDKITGVAEYGVGGGIVWDSDAAEEWAESRTKALILGSDGLVQVTQADLPPLPDDYRVALAPIALPVEDDPFVRHKTTHRAIYDQARALVAGADDVLLWNSRGELTESTIANLLVELDGEWVTPPAGSGLLPGVCRRELLERGLVRERVIHVSDLARCTGIALANSLRGRWKVRLVDHEHPHRALAAYTAG